jgi:pilus assembly protein CpaB
MFQNRRFVMVAATALAAIAALAVFMYAHGVRTAAKDQAGVTVAVATKDIPAGTLLGTSSDAVAMRRVSRDDAIPGALTSHGDLAGARTAVPVLEGQQISEGMLQGRNTVQGGTLGIPKGMVAETVPLETYREVGGAMASGDHVTIYATFEPSDQSAPSTSVTLVSNALLLKVDAPTVSDATSGGSTDPTLVTMALRPRDAQKVVYAQEEGSIWLALLPPNQQGTRVPPTTFAEVAR